MTDPARLDDGRMLFVAFQHPRHGWALTGPELVICGFDSQNAALDWLRVFLDDTARRNAAFAREQAMDEERLAIEREEMLARLLEPQAKQ